MTAAPVCMTLLATLLPGVTFSDFASVQQANETHRLIDVAYQWRNMLLTAADSTERELHSIMKGFSGTAERQAQLKRRAARSILPANEEETIMDPTRCDCTIWRAALPPIADEIDAVDAEGKAVSYKPSKWLVHRSETVHGLGDFLAGLMSAFLVAAASRRRFFVQHRVDHAFNPSLVSFAPYDVPPPIGLETQTITIPQHTCKSVHPLSARVVALQGDSFPTPHNRACAWAWHSQLEPLWHSMNGSSGAGLPCHRRHRALDASNRDRTSTDSVLSGLVTQPSLVYGCLLRFLMKPKQRVTRLIPRAPPGFYVIAIHVRTSDTAFGQSCSKFASNQELVDLAREIQVAAASFNTGPKIYYRLEQDDPCSWATLAELVVQKCPVETCSVAPRIATPSHDVAKSPQQLAAWFAMSAADAFIVSPMFAVLSQNRSYAKYGWIPPEAWSQYYRLRGFVDHAILRLSSWSLFAALRSGVNEFRVLCAKAPPSEWETLRRAHVGLVEKAPKYICYSNRPSKVTLTHGQYAKATTHSRAVYLSHVNAHFLTMHTNPNDPITWGVGTFA